MAIVYYPTEHTYIGLSTDDKSFLNQEGAKLYLVDLQKTQIYHNGIWSDYISVVTSQVLSATVLNIPSTAITSTTTSANLSVGVYKELAVDINISAITGTTPTYQLMVDRLGADGVWYNIYAGSSITAVGVVSISLGVGASTNVSFGSTIRIREIVGGTTPSVTRSVSIIGK